jgi:hypothetical protein
MNYERAREHYKENIKGGWTSWAAWDDACCSYALSIEDAEKLRKYAKLPANRF